MARKKKSNSGGGALIGLLFLFALLAAIPKAAWIAIGVFAAIGLAVYLYLNSKNKAAPSTPANDRVRPPLALSSGIAMRPEPLQPRQREAPLHKAAQPPLEAADDWVPPPPVVSLIAPVTLAAPRPLQREAPLVPASDPSLVVQNNPVPQPPPPAVSLDAPPPPAALRPIQRDTPVPRVANPDEPVSVVVALKKTVAPAFRVPAAPKSYGPGTWVSRGQAVEIAGVTIPDGMVYVGTSLATRLGEADPCLIDPSKSVAARGDYTERQMGYWPSYSEISGAARRAYLNWLAGGRSDPEADVGYVFLFFYGLERRAILDAAKDPVAQADWASISEEIRRLLSIYGEKSNSFRSYASELLNWVSLAEHPAQLYEKPVPAFPRTYEVPLYVRLALGQAAVAGAPVPVHLALAWIKLDPNTYLRTPAIRCAEQFDALFAEKYAAAFGPGIIIPRNRTKLKFVYRAASAGFRGFEELKLSFGDTPDVTVLTAPIKKLQQIAEATTTELDAYSRYLGKNPDAKGSLEGLLQLPAAVWPAAARNAFRALKTRMGDGMVVMPFQELLRTLDAKTAFTKDRTQALVRALESMNVGFEPDVLGGAKLPKPDEQVVLFAIPPGEVATHTTHNYQAALLTLQLASAVAAADGEFSIQEVGHLRSQVQAWTHLTLGHQRRLLAHLRLLMAAPMSLTTLKKKLEPLETAAKESIAAFMATLVQADGTVSPAELKMLEKVYKTLGLDAKKVFSDVHAVVAGTTPSVASMAKVEQSGFTLDAHRIAALQQDTAKVSALLAGIFKEDEAVAAPAVDADVEREQPVAPQGLLGLDEAHSALARMLLSRPQWSRAELLDIAADLDLMLDGAIERINEASFDTHDIPFTEGDDPIEVNTDVLEKIEA